jgi:ABC-type amino acid transport substrate-binding protein
MRRKGIVMRYCAAFFGVALGAAMLTPASAQTVRIAHPQLGVIISSANGETVGEVADILRAAAEREHLEITFVPIVGNSQKSLESGSADAVAPYLATPQGSRVYDFSTTLMTAGGGLFVRAPLAAPSDLQTLAGKTVATPSFGPFVKYIQANFPTVHVVSTASYQESLDRVLAGKADAAALNIQEGANVVSKSYAGKISVPTAAFLDEPLVLAVLKGRNADLVDRINAGIAAIRADGTLQAIEAKWTRRP